jgi:outer membrane protein insertion porin family
MLRTIPHLKPWLIILFLISSINAHASLRLHSIELRDDKNQPVELSELNLESFPIEEDSEITGEVLSRLMGSLLDHSHDFSHASATLLPVDEGTPDRVRLLIELQRERMLRSVRVLLKFDHSEKDPLVREMRTQRNQVFSQAHIEHDVLKLRDHFWEKGHYNVQVLPQIIEIDPRRGHIGVTYHVESTGVVRIREMGFKLQDNNELLSSRERERLLKRLQDETSFQTRSFFLASRPLLDRGQIEQDQIKLERILAEEGFDAAEVNLAVSINSRGLANLEYNITLGGATRIQSLGFLPDREISSRLYGQLGEGPLRAGGLFSPIRFRRHLEHIRASYGEQGYLFTHVLGDYNSTSEHIDFIIHTGPQFKPQTIRFEGLERLRHDRAMLDINLRSDATLTKTAIERQIDRLMKTGLYANVEVEMETSSEGPVEEVVTGVLIFHVEEARTQELSFSLGASSSGAIGQVGYTVGQIGGIGARASIYGQISQELKKLGIVFNDPHVAGSLWSGSYSAEVEQRSTEYQDSEHLRFRALFERELNDRLRVGVGARVEFVRADILHHYLNDDPIKLRQDTTITGLLGTLTYSDTERDSMGSIASGRIVRGILMPSYSDNGAYAKAVIEAIEVIELGRNDWGSAHTLSGRILIGATTAKAPEIERFSAGGIGTLRGHRPGSLRAQDGSSGVAVISANLTYSFPVYQDKLKGVLFLETASVTNSHRRVGDFRVVGGFGVRANLGRALLAPQVEAGFAYALDRRSGDALRPFYLIFGEYDPRFDL